MKSIFFISLTFIVICCRTSTLSPDKAFYSTCMPLSVQGTAIFLDINLDNRPTKLLLDTSAEGVSIYNSGMGTETQPEKHKNDLRLLRCPLFKSDINVSKSDERLPPGCMGRIPIDILFQKKTALKLDFTRGTICTINEAALKKFKFVEGYTEVKSKLIKGKIYLDIEIDGAIVRVMLDTRYNGSIALPAGNLAETSKTAKVNLSGIVNSTDVVQTAKIRVPCIGMDLITAFDWIIDHQNDAVYLRRNHKPVSGVIAKN